MVELCKICTSTNDGFALIKHSIINDVCSLMIIVADDDDDDDDVDDDIACCC